ncbi:GDP-mannose 4,6-dehydratase [Acidobacteriota bacterium]
MKILITGAGGFIGSHLVEQCLRIGYDIKAFVHYNSRNHWGWLENSDAKNHIEVISGDIRDFDAVFSASRSADAIIHLAALIGIPYSYRSPQAYIRTNIEGAYNILESSKIHGVGQVLITSTSETYGTAHYVPIDETHPILGQSPYAASKIGADQLALSYYFSYGMPIKIVRPFNTFGPRQSARGIIPSIIVQILNGKGDIKIGNLNPTRDFTYVKDTVAGFIEILKTDSLFGEVMNIGTNHEISIGDLANSIIEIMRSDMKKNIEKSRLRPKLSEVERLKCDNAKIITHTDWRPTVELSEGLKLTIEWISENISYYKADHYNI